jgi:lytic murein transglycosylase
MRHGWRTNALTVSLTGRLRRLRLGIGAFIIAAFAAGLHAPAADAAPFAPCVKDLRASALKAGVNADVVEAAFRDMTFDERVLRFQRSQPEYRLAIWDYMAFLVDEARIADGKKMFSVEAKSLAAIEKAYGVDRYILLGLWGVESDYGRLEGDFFLPRALASLACAGKRPGLFRSELIHALKIVAAGDVKLKDFTGSWAGAFGHTQFMPSTYRRLAVDFDRDGRKDTINSIPDALASAANYLKRSGWRPGQPWGFEVKLPASYKGPVGRKQKAAISVWTKRGLTRADGSPLPKSGSYGLLKPAGKNGPAFLVTRNFDALYSYNAAESYALAIAHLSDRLRGKSKFVKAWPTDDPGLSRAERKRLQELLIARGLYKGDADGKMGPLTAEAIREAEKQAGLKPTGRPGARILKALSDG